MRFLFTNDGAIEAANADINSTNDLPHGKVGIFDVRDYASGNINLEGAADSLPDQFQIGIGADNDDNIRYTNVLDKNRIKRVTVKPYQAPVKQVSHITPATGHEGRPLIKFTRVDGGFEPFPRNSYDVKQEEGDDAEAIVDKFVTAINDSPKTTINDQEKRFVEASKSGTGESAVLVVTSLHDNLSFHTSFDSEASQDYEVSIEVTPLRGSGTPEQLKELEEMSWGNLSYYQRVVLPQTPFSFVKSGETYDIVAIEYENNYDTSINKSFSHQEITFAFEEGQLADDGQVFAGIFGAPVYAPNAEDDAT